MQHRWLSLVFACVFAAGTGLVQHARATEAIDPTTSGPFNSTSGEYKLKAVVDPLVTSALRTELWSKVWYPVGSTGRLPLVIMLHGEHGTCGHPDPTGKWRIDDNKDYTTTGTCPDGYVVTPNHWGYDYIGYALAAHGYLVVSINANRGVNQADIVPSENDPSNILRRGRLILRHLVQLSDWNTNGKTPNALGFEFRNRIDFTRVSLFGHSRGGDGIVAAYNLFNDTSTGWKGRLPTNLQFTAIAAIAPTDAQNTKPTVTGVPYGVLLPMCDGDVVRLAGVRFYDRTLSGGNADSIGNFKATFATWGADHDGYNTEWHPQDSYDFAHQNNGTLSCPDQNKLFRAIGTVADQQVLGRYFTMAMVRANSEHTDLGQLLNPAYSLPSNMASITRIDRTYFPGGTAQRLIRFDAPKKGDCAPKLATTDGAVSSCGIPPEHDPSNWIARLRWGPPAGATTTNYFAQFTLNGGKPVNLRARSTIEFRIGPDCKLIQPDPDYGCSNQSLQQDDASAAGSQNVLAILEDAQGHFSQYADIGAHVERRQAVGLKESPINPQTLINPLYHAILSSSRVPLSEFLVTTEQGFDIKNVQYIWIYMAPGRGGLFVGDIWATNAGTTSMQLAGATRRGTLPRPRNVALRPATEEPLVDSVEMAEVATTAVTPADSGNQIVAVRRIPVAAPTTNQTATPQSQAMVEFTVATPRPLIENSSGYMLSIGNRRIPAQQVAHSSTGKVSLTRLLVPAAEVAAAKDGVSLAVASGGSVWSFGAFNKGAIR